MFIIFGTRYRVKQLGQDMQACLRCGRETVHTTLTRQMWFTLFFIPVFPISKNSTLQVCNLCGQMTEVAQVNPALVSAGPITKSCPNCAKPMLAEDAICSYCGHLTSGYEGELSA